MIKYALLAVSLIALFFLLPTEGTTGRYYLNCDVSPQEASRRWSAAPPPRKDQQELDLGTANIFGGDIKVKPYEQRLKEWQDRPRETTEEISVHKSGLRRAVEGRLAWLGIPSELDWLNHGCKAPV